MKTFYALLLAFGFSLIAVPVSAQTQSQAMAPAQPVAAAATPAGVAAAPYTSPPAAAADTPTVFSPSDSALPDFLSAQSKLHNAEAAPAADESLFFTPWQHALLEEAKRGYATRSASGIPVDTGKQVAAIREISLGGILYRAPRDWTIYLNNRRVTPVTLPQEVLDIQVSDDDIRLKWFDSQTNLIFPIVLRANQRFNLDARIFLPGVGVPAAPVAATP